jgi:sorting nexin-4
MENDDFANVSWQSDNSPKGKESAIKSPRSGSEGDNSTGAMNGKRQGNAGPLGRNPDELDLAGVGEAVIECTVNTPIKENDGSKDAYVSYLVTTHVCVLNAVGVLRWC